MPAPRKAWQRGPAAWDERAGPAAGAMPRRG